MHTARSPDSSIWLKSQAFFLTRRRFCAPSSSCKQTPHRSIWLPTIGHRRRPESSNWLTNGSNNYLPNLGMLRFRFTSRCRPRTGQTVHSGVLLPLGRYGCEEVVGNVEAVDSPLLPAGLAVLVVAIALFARLEATISKDQKPIWRADVPAGAGKTDRPLVRPSQFDSEDRQARYCHQLSS